MASFESNLTMNKHLLFLLVIALAGCTSDKSSNVETNDFHFSYELDTVMVDAGEHFFFLNGDLGLSDVSTNGKFLYNLNPKTYLLEIVDLDGLKLEKTVQLEKEGPDGIGLPYYGKIQVLENGNICLFGQFKINIVSEEGKLVDVIEFDQIPLKDYGLPEDEKIGSQGIISNDGKLFASTVSNVDYRKPGSGIVLVNLETDSIKYLPLSILQELKQFEILMQSGNTPGMLIGERIFLGFMKEDLIISSSAFNESYRYSPSHDSLIHQTYTSQLTEDKKIVNFRTRVENGKESAEAEAAKSAQVDFMDFRDMQKNKLNWRVTRDKDRMIGDSIVFKQVLTLFDPEFNMLKEQELEDFYPSSKSFFKDGMLYSFININDEMAFVRLKPTFTYE